MTSRFPEPSDPFEDEGQASSEPGLASKRITGDVQDDVTVPDENPIAVNDWGTTAEEEVEGEPLDGRLARELPDLTDVGEPDYSADSDMPYPSDAEERVGRLVDPDQGGGPDTEADEVADDVGTDNGGFSEEERAMHIEPDPET